MEHLDRYPQAVRRRPPLCRQDSLITWHQPQHGISPILPTHFRVLRAAFIWAIIIYSVVAVLIALGPSHQYSAIEIAFRTSEILIRCFHQLCVDAGKILNELIADWNSINASLDWAS